MIGLLMNITLLVLAGATSNKGRKQKRRIKAANKALQDTESQLCVLQQKLEQRNTRAEGQLRQKELQWSKAFDEQKEAFLGMERALHESLEEKQEELASLEELDLNLKRVEELEEERFAIRQEIALLESKLLELHNQCLLESASCSHKQGAKNMN